MLSDDVIFVSVRDWKPHKSLLGLSQVEYGMGCADGGPRSANCIDDDTVNVRRHQLTADP